MSNEILLASYVLVFVERKKIEEMKRQCESELKSIAESIHLELYKMAGVLSRLVESKKVVPILVSTGKEISTSSGKIPKSHQ